MIFDRRLHGSMCGFDFEEMAKIRFDQGVNIDIEIDIFVLDLEPFTVFFDFQLIAGSKYSR